MSIDHSWTAKHPGLIPLAILRDGLEKANKKVGPETQLTFVRGEEEEADPIDEDEIVEAGAVFLVRAKGLGHITLFQPDDEVGRFHMGVSSTTEGRGPHFDKLADVADTLAGCLGMVIDHDEGVKEELEKLAARGGPPVNVTSVRVEIGLEKGGPRVVEIEGSPLATIGASQIEALEVGTLRAVSHALAFSSRADGRTTLNDLVTWATEAGYRLESRDGDMAHLEPVDEDGEVSLPMLSVSVSERDVDIVSYPDLEMDHEHGLEHNYVEFSGAAKLSLDSEGDWSFNTIIRRQALDRAFFLETLEQFVDDLRDLIEGHGEGGEGGEEGEEADADADEEEEAGDEEDAEADEEEEEVSADANATAEAAAAAEITNKSAPSKLLMLERYSAPAKAVIRDAQRIADEKKHVEMTILHMLTACLNLSAAQKLAAAEGADVEAARKKLDAALAVLPKGNEQSWVSRDALAVLQRVESNMGDAEVKFPDVMRAVVAYANGGGNSAEVRALRRVVEAGRLGRLADPQH